MDTTWVAKARNEIENLIMKEERMMDGANKLKQAYYFNEDMSGVVLQRAAAVVKELKKILEELERNPEQYKEDFSDHRDHTPMKEKVDYFISTKMEQYYKTLLDKEKIILNGFQRIQKANNERKFGVLEREFRENIQASKSKIRKYEMIIRSEEVQKFKNKLDQERIDLETNGIVHKHFPMYSLPKLHIRNRKLLESQIQVQKKLLEGSHRMIEASKSKKTKEELRLTERNICEKIDLLMAAFETYNLATNHVPTDKCEVPEFEISGTFFFTLHGICDIPVTVPNRDPKLCSLAYQRKESAASKISLKKSSTPLLDPGICNF